MRSHGALAYERRSFENWSWLSRVSDWWCGLKRVMIRSVDYSGTKCSAAIGIPFLQKEWNFRSSRTGHSLQDPMSPYYGTDHPFCGPSLLIWA